MKRILFGKLSVALTVCALVGAVASPAFAHTVNDTLPGGTGVSVAIDNPTDGAPLPAGPVTVTGSASVAESQPVANTALVYVLDVSGSTNAPVPGGCGGGTGGDVLDCEILAAQSLNTAAIAAQTIGAVGAAVFATSGAAADVTPAGADDQITGPATDAGGAGGPDIEEVLASAVNNQGGGITEFTPHSVGGGTNFDAGITAATSVATDPDNDMDRTIVAFMSDGFGGGTSALDQVPSNVDIFPFAVGAGATCGDTNNDNSLQHIADATGGLCEEVEDVATLPAILPGVIASELSTLTLRVDGGAAIPITDVTPALPRTGPASVDYRVDTGPLTVGVHELCVTATGSDLGGVDTVTDCHEGIIHLPAEAFAIEANGLLTIPKTPHATCPPDGSLTLAQLNAGIASVAALHAECAVDPDTGETTALAAVDQASLLGGLITISDIESTCLANGDGVSSSSSVGMINGTPIGVGSGSLTIPLVAQVFFNETTTGPDGELVQNAVRVRTILGQEIILAGCRLG